VIVWINGAFGAGKTTTAGLVVERLAGAKLFDPEYVGYMLSAFVERPTGDFQDLPLWRRLVVQTMAGLTEFHPHPWVAPMSLIRADYRAEILGGLRAAGADVREVILDVPEKELKARIEAHDEARDWRRAHVDQALATFAALKDGVFVDGTRAPAEVADEIVRIVGIPQTA
jgi:predicted kinase